MANNFTPVGAEFQVNVSPPASYNVISNTQSDVDAAALTDGRFAAVYTSEYSGNPGTDTDVFLQFFNADGTRSGSLIPIDVIPGFQREAAVAPRLGGGAVVAWIDVDGNLTNGISARVVDANGVAGTVLTIADTTQSNVTPDIASFSNGDSIVVFPILVTATQVALDARIINANGTLGSTYQVMSFGGVAAVTPAVATSGDNALIVYEEDKSTGHSIVARLFNDTTHTVSPGHLVDPIVVSGGGALAHPDVAALTDGRYIVVWENDTNDNVEGRFLDAAGNPIGAAFAISTNAGHDEDPRVAALPNGHFIVAWDNDGRVFESGSGWEVLARRFDANGAPAGDLFLANTADSAAAQYYPGVAANAATGQAFIAWQDFHNFGPGQDDSPSGIRGHAFVAATDVINGTPNPDVLTAYSLGETIFGLAGNDVIDAHTGADWINGGPGGDTMFAGLDNDRDIFAYSAKTDVGKSAAKRDHIFQFDRAANKHDLTSDKIDLSLIDADKHVHGNQKFRFVSAFAVDPASATHGEVMVVKSGHNVKVLVDFNGDTTTDAMILVHDLTTLHKYDFLL